MIRQLSIANYKFECDREATAAAYSQIETPGPERCTCWWCQNWVAGRERLVPQSVRELLTELGIPPSGEIEVFELSVVENGRRLYGGWYLFVGRILAAPARESWQMPDEIPLDGWRLGIPNERLYSVPAFDAFNYCVLNFLAYVPDFIGIGAAFLQPVCPPRNQGAPAPSANASERDEQPRADGPADSSAQAIGLG